jgi:hypothetical protein
MLSVSRLLYASFHFIGEEGRSLSPKTIEEMGTRLATNGRIHIGLSLDSCPQPSQFPCGVTGFTSPGLSQTISPHLLFPRSVMSTVYGGTRARHILPTHYRAKFDITAIITITVTVTVTYSSPGPREL